MDFYTKIYSKRKCKRKEKDKGVSYCLTVALLSIFGLVTYFKYVLCPYQNNITLLLWTPQNHSTTIFTVFDCLQAAGD